MKRCECCNKDLMEVCKYHCHMCNPIKYICFDCSVILFNDDSGYCFRHYSYWIRNNTNKYNYQEFKKLICCICGLNIHQYCFNDEYAIVCKSCYLKSGLYDNIIKVHRII